MNDVNKKMKVYVKLQTPIIEMVLEATDGSGTTETLIVGFKRHTPEVAQERTRVYGAMAGKLMEIEGEDGQTQQMLAMQDYIAKDVLYLKEVKLVLETETGEMVEKTVKDTRKVQDDETLWGAADNAVHYLLQLYLPSAPWGVAFTTAWLRAMSNLDLRKEAKIKN